MGRRGFNLGLGFRGTSVVASAPRKLLCVLWLLSGHRPLEDTIDVERSAGRNGRSSRLKTGWVG